MQSQEPLSNTKIDTTIEQKIDNLNNKLTENSLAYEIINELKKSNKRQFIMIVLLAVFWFATVVGFGIYLNQFDFENSRVIEESIEANQDGENNSVNGGDIIYGTTDS